jgi:hypothetical protein
MTDISDAILIGQQMSFTFSLGESNRNIHSGSALLLVLALRPCRKWRGHLRRWCAPLPPENKAAPKNPGKKQPFGTSAHGYGGLF